MSPGIILSCISIYFFILLFIAWLTSRHATNDSYFLGNKQSPWYVVAFGMIGDSLSGVTFLSLPGTVLLAQFGYMQMVLGYVLGYFVIAGILLPLYYKLNLTSIYSYLNTRFGAVTQKTGSFFFLISRLIGAALRLLLAAGVIQLFVSEPLHVPFAITVSIIIFLILLYTFQGGIKTLVWTDTFQSLMLLGGVLISILLIAQHLDFNFSEMITAVYQSEYSRMFFFDNWREKSFFFKQFISGAFIAIVMTGLDQNMMQKNLSIRSLPDAQKNMRVFSFIVVLVNLFFVSLGALLYIYANSKGISLPANADTGKIITDQVFSFIALNQLGGIAAIIFIVGLTAATFNSADSVLTTLTTSFCIDFLNMEHHETKEQEARVKKYRIIVHFAFAFLLLMTILLAAELNTTSILDAIFTVAAYTYGPLLGLFAFGLFTKRICIDYLTPVICFISPFITFLLHTYSEQLLNGYKFGYELLLINGLLTFVGLMLISKKTKTIF